MHSTTYSIIVESLILQLLRRILCIELPIYGIIARRVTPKKTRTLYQNLRRRTEVTRLNASPSSSTLSSVTHILLQSTSGQQKWTPRKQHSAESKNAVRESPGDYLSTSTTWRSQSLQSTLSRLLLQPATRPCTRLPHSSDQVPTIHTTLHPSHLHIDHGGCRFLLR